MCVYLQGSNVEGNQALHIVAGACVYVNIHVHVYICIYIHTYQVANVEGNQALQLAAEAGFPEVAKVLLDKGVSPDAVNKVRTSTLLHA